MSLQKTPLHAEHVALGGKMVEFGGWEMPLQYAVGILAEHEATRTAAGLFDVSHMGRFDFSGPGGLDLANHLITNNLKKLESGRLLYTALCDEKGGVLDDVTVYKYEDRALMVVNAGNRTKVWDWIAAQNEAWTGESAQVLDRSEALGQLAIQGPKAEEMILSHVDGDLDAVGYYEFLEAPLFGVPSLLSRNGYTGEDGFELYIPSEHLVAVTRKILAAGAPAGLVPAGLGCRDTLRLEMAYCLYGNELNESVTPLEAGLGWTVKLKQKTPFVGQDALRAQKASGVEYELAGFRVEGRRLARAGQTVFRGDEPVGEVTSGCFSPSLQHGIGMGRLKKDASVLGTRLEVEVRNTRVPVEIVDRPFYKDASHR